MAVAQMERPTETQLNELYWNTDRTVDEIVDEMGIGKNTLYASIDPLPTTAECPTCGGTLAFSNRTDRANSLGTCESCGTEAVVAEDAIAGRRRPRALMERVRSEFPGIEPEKAAAIGGVAALGLMLGAAAARGLRN